MESFIHGAQAFRLRAFDLPKLTALKQREVCHALTFICLLIPEDGKKVEKQNLDVRYKAQSSHDFSCAVSGIYLLQYPDLAMELRGYVKLKSHACISTLLE